MKEINVPVWYSNESGWMVRRSALESDHPESTYMYIKSTLGLVPEDYGIFHSDIEMNKDLLDKPKEYLVKMIADLRKEVLVYEMWGCN